MIWYRKPAQPRPAFGTTLWKRKFAFLPTPMTDNTEVMLWLDWYYTKYTYTSYIHPITNENCYYWKSSDRHLSAPEQNACT